MPRWLLLSGVVAGPVYILVAGIQALTREGFEPSRHPVSLLSNGEYGWIQILNFVIVGILVIAAAFGLRMALTSGIGSRWIPVLIGIYGAGLVASGIFVADPSHGFPPGTAAGNPEELSASGMMHFVAGGVAFIAFIASCFVYARRFAESQSGRWAAFSAITGAVFLVGFSSTAIFAGEPAAIVLFTIAVVLGWLWLAAISLLELSGITETDRGVLPVSAT